MAVAVLVDAVSFLYGAVLPGFDEDDVVLADPQVPFHPAGDPADAYVSVEAAYAQASCSEALVDDSEGFCSLG